MSRKMFTFGINEIKQISNNSQCVCDVKDNEHEIYNFVENSTQMKALRSIGLGSKALCIWLDTRDRLMIFPAPENLGELLDDMGFLSVTLGIETVESIMYDFFERCWNPDVIVTPIEFVNAVERVQVYYAKKASNKSDRKYYISKEWTDYVISDEIEFVKGQGAKVETLFETQQDLLDSVEKRGGLGNGQTAYRKTTLVLSEAKSDKIEKYMTDVRPELITIGSAKPMVPDIDTLLKLYLLSLRDEDVKGLVGPVNLWKVINDYVEICFMPAVDSVDLVVLRDSILCIPNASIANASTVEELHDIFVNVGMLNETLPKDFLV